MKVAFLGDNGVGPWHINIFGNLPNIEFFVSDRNKHAVDAPIYHLSNKTNILPNYECQSNLWSFSGLLTSSGNDAIIVLLNIV